MTMLKYNGQILPEEECRLTIENRGFFYGDGFFETIRLMNGTPLHLEDHIDRMNRSFQFLHLQPPFAPDTVTLAGLITVLAEVNHIARGGRVRITFFRESGGYYTPNHDKCGYLIQVHPLQENLYELNHQGLHLALYTQNVKPVQPMYSLKTLNSMLYVLAGIYARENGCDDACIMNDNENIIETSHSNLFIVKHETIVTPGLDEGCIPGVMRLNVLKIIENKTGYKLERGNIRLKDILEADEIFLTNAIKGIQWVVGFREKRYYHNVSAILTRLLQDYCLGK